jgi:hypothetical protein
VTGYTIPGETRRPYALVGPLSLGQAAWLGGAGVVVWHLVAIPMPMVVRVAAASAAASVALALAFLRWPAGDAGEPATVWAVRGARFLLSPRRATLRRGLPALEMVREVRAGAARVGDALVRVLEVAAAPFELKDSAEREAFLAGYRAFLHALPGPVQIVSVSERLRLDAYVGQLREAARERGGRIGEQMAAHARFLEGLIHARHIMTRRHYVVLRRPCREGAGRIEDALHQLGVDEAAVAAALQRLGLASRPLDDLDLANLIRASYLGAAAPLPAAPSAFATLASVGGQRGR